MSSSDYRRVARENLAGNWWLSIGVAAIVCLLGGLLVGSNFIPEIKYQLESEGTNLTDQLSSLRISSGSFSGFYFSFSALGILQFVLGGVIQLGYTKYLLNQYNKSTFTFRDIFSQFDRFGQGFAQKFLRTLYTFLWSLLFIIPGIVKSLSYSMTPFIMAENPDMTAGEAITASKELMYGHRLELFILDLTFIGWDLLANFTLGINGVSIKLALGHLALNPYKNAARAAFYKDITSGTGTEA